MRLPLPVVRAVVGSASRLLGPPVPIAVQRAVVNASGGVLPRSVTATKGRLGDRPVLSLAGPAAVGHVLWLHGGAFITGSPFSHRTFGAALALASGATVHLLDYRLAPEHQHPAAVEDALAALNALPRAVLGGDSAGGAHALLTALEGPELAGLALVSPVVDLTMTSSGAYPERDLVVSRAWSTAGTRACFGADRKNLLEADLSALPHTVLHVSEHERLRAEGERLAGLLPSCELTVLPGVWHDVHLQAGLLRESDDAVVLLGAAVQALLTA